MDGIHDLGGKQGFGPIPVDGGESPICDDWEQRMWAIVRAGVWGPDITIDWFRHSLERMVPSDYLAYRYFQKWCTTYFALLIDSGTLTMEEVRSGRTERPADPADARTLEEVLAAIRASNRSFEVESSAEPLFKPGDRVATRRWMNAYHTRLPAYARGAEGEVIAHHGAHLLPDKCAHGIHEGEHLYTVAFTARALWGESADPRDSVALEVWESYLVPP